jgi:hypothetical protein
MRSNSNQKAKVKGPRQNPKKQRGPARESAATGPTQFKSNVTLSHKYRFTASAAVNEAMTDTALLAAMGGIAYDATHIALFTESFRLKKVEVWSSPASQGANSTCSVDWVGFGNTPNIEFSDTTLSVNRNAHVVCAPPSQSLAKFWQKATGTSLFTLVCPINSIVEISVDQVLSDQEVALSTATVVTAVAQHIYYLGADPSRLLIPVSLNTTI